MNKNAFSIAVVDDDDSFARARGRLLRASGFEVHTYASSEAFLAAPPHPRLDCLVLDIQLGGMSGLELHRQLNSSGSTTPVIYITAHDEPATREAAQAAGCAAYFRKTAPGEAVLQAIRCAAGVKKDGQ